MEMQYQSYADGKSIIPGKADFTVKKGKEIVQPSDFEIISVTNNTKIGTATVVIRGNGKYCGMKKVSFKIVKNNF